MPAGQGRQDEAPADEKVPGGQSVQAVVPFGAQEPAAHFHASQGLQRVKDFFSWKSCLPTSHLLRTAGGWLARFPPQDHITLGLPAHLVAQNDNDMSSVRVPLGRCLATSFFFHEVRRCPPRSPSW